MIIALLLFGFQIGLNVMLPDWLQVFVICWAILLHLVLYEMGLARREFRVLWLFDFCIFTVYAPHFRITSLLVCTFGYILLVNILELIFHKYDEIEREIEEEMGGGVREVLETNGEMTGVSLWLIILGVLLVVADLIAVNFLYTGSFIEKMSGAVVPLVYPSVNDAWVVETSSAIGAGDFIISMFLIRYMGLGRVAFPFVFLIAFIATDILASIFVLPFFPMLFTIVPTVFLFRAGACLLKFIWGKCMKRYVVRKDNACMRG